MLEHKVFRTTVHLLDIDGRWITMESGTGYLHLMSGLSFLFVSVKDSS